MTYRIDKEESRRLDVLKVLMCIFVLVIHAFSDDYSPEGGAYGILYGITFAVSRLICDCAVPVFILISSVLLYAKPFSFWSNLKKKCRSLLVPYFVFNTLWIATIAVKNILVPGAEEGGLDFTKFTLFDWLDAYLGLRGETEYKPLLSVLWYVRDLFLLNLLALPIKKVVDWLPVPVLIATMTLWISGISIPGIGTYSLCFFVLGYYLVKYDIHVTYADRPWGKILIPVVYLLVLAVDILLERQLVVNHIFVLISILFWARYSKFFIRFTKVTGLILPASFFIYLTHRFVYAGFQFFENGSVGVFLIQYLLKPPVALAVLLGVFYLLKRFLPRVLAVMLGGRVERRPAKTL